jgi:general secretion pathway protein D
LATWLAGGGFAQAEDESAQARLERAVTMYQAQDYEAALRLVREVDTENLSKADRKRLARYIELTQTALDQHHQARSHLEQGKAALSAGKYSTARPLLDKVVESEFATPDMKKAAEIELALISNAELQRPRLTSAQDDSPNQDDSESGVRRADQLVRRGQEATSRGDYNRARSFFNAALELVPGQPEALRGLERLRSHEQVEAAPDEQPRIRLIDRMQQRRRVLWQRAVAAYRQSESDVHDFVEQNQYKLAVRALQSARETIEANRQYAEPLARYEGLKAEYQELAKMVDERQQAYNAEQSERIRLDLEQREAGRLDRMEAEKRRQIDLLMAQVDQKLEDRDLRGASQALRQVMVIDPKNIQAEWMMDQIGDMEAVRRQNTAWKTSEIEERKLLLEVDEATVPWSGELNYPENWLNIIRSPHRQLPGEYPLDVEEGDFEESFRARIPEISFNQLELENALQQVADIGNINIVPNWPDLALAGVTPDTRVTLRKLRNVSVRTVLEEVIDQAEGASSAPINYAVRGSGILKVATDDFLNREVFMHIYDAKDLIHPVENHRDAPEFDLAKLREKHDRIERRGSLFDRGLAYDTDPRESFDRDYQSEQRAELVDLIKQHVAPQSWRSTGGAHATIHARADGNLVITQTSAAHREIFNLLNLLREDDAVQIAIEARFLTVNHNFLEDMGIDLNIVLNNGNAGFDQGFSGGNAAFDPATGSRLLLPRNFSRLGFGPNVAPGGNNLGGVINPDQPFGNAGLVPQNRGSGNGNFYTPIPINTNLRQYTDPSTLASDVPGSFAGNVLAPALQIAGSFLDNIQVDFLIRATQADQRTSTLIAPKLIMTNGQQSWIAITEEQNFVSQLDPVVASGAAAQAPIVDTLNTGAVLNVQATVSPDRRYVTMNLQPGVGRLIAINTFQFSGGPITGVGAPGFVQLPIIQRQQVKTTVTVPDGGTLLIGGQKLTFETESEAGVPVLSKIPILKRLYSSRATIKDEQVLLILIKPEILIKEEQEELAHPTMSSLR